MNRSGTPSIGTITRLTTLCLTVSIMIFALASTPNIYAQIFAVIILIVLFIVLSLYALQRLQSDLS